MVRKFNFHILTDSAILIDIKRSEEMLSKLSSLTIPIEVGINFRELVQSESAVGTIPSEASVPILIIMINVSHTCTNEQQGHTHQARYQD